MESNRTQVDQLLYWSYTKNIEQISDEKEEQPELVTLLTSLVFFWSQLS